MKKLLLLAAVAAVGGGYCSEDDSYSSSDPISEEKPNDEQSIDSTAVSASRRKMGDVFIGFSDSEECKRADKLADEGTTAEEKISPDIQRLTPYERDFIANARKYLLQKSGAKDNETKDLLANNMDCNVYIKGPATLRKEGELTTCSGKSGGSLILIEKWVNFVVDGSAEVSDISIAGDLVVIGDLIVSGELNISGYLYVRGKITKLDGANLIVGRSIPNPSVDTEETTDTDENVNE
jgi:hypothetical protein